MALVDDALGVVNRAVAGLVARAIPAGTLLDAPDGTRWCFVCVNAQHEAELMRQPFGRVETCVVDVEEFASTWTIARGVVNAHLGDAS